MSAYQGGPLDQYTAFNAGVIPNDVFGVAINWFVNRTPLISRLPKVPVGSPNFLITNDNYRPRSQALTGNYTTTQTTLTVTDGTVYDIGDVLQIQTELFLVTGTYDTGTGTATTVTVTYGYNSTTNANHTTPQTVYLLGNTRTGAEINQTSVSRIPQAVTQYNETVQHAYQVGGALQADLNYTTGFPTPLDRDRMLAMQHVMDDFEASIYYGAGVNVSGGTGTRPMMKGIIGPPGLTLGLLQTNVQSSPTNAGAYKPSDMIRDTVQAVFNGGGNPDVLILSTDFLQGMAIWGHAAMRINSGANVYGTPIDTFQCPFLSDIAVIPAPLLRAGTAICLSSPEVRTRLKRPMIDKPRGSRGDAYEGDVIMEGAIEVDNEAHHAVVYNITGYAAA